MRALFAVGLQTLVKEADPTRCMFVVHRSALDMSRDEDKADTQSYNMCLTRAMVRTLSYLTMQQSTPSVCMGMTR